MQLSIEIHLVAFYMLSQGWTFKKYQDIGNEKKTKLQLNRKYPFKLHVRPEIHLLKHLTLLSSMQPCNPMKSSCLNPHWLHLWKVSTPCIEILLVAFWIISDGYTFGDINRFEIKTRENAT